VPALLAQRPELKKLLLERGVLLHLLRPGDIHRLLGVMLRSPASKGEANSELETLIAEVKEKRQGKDNDRDGANRISGYRLLGSGNNLKADNKLIKKPQIGKGEVRMGGGGGGEMAQNQKTPSPGPKGSRPTIPNTGVNRYQPINNPTAPPPPLAHPPPPHLPPQVSEVDQVPQPFQTNKESSFLASEITTNNKEPFKKPPPNQSTVHHPTSEVQVEVRQPEQLPPMVNQKLSYKGFPQQKPMQIHREEQGLGIWPQPAFPGPAVPFLPEQEIMENIKPKEENVIWGQNSVRHQQVRSKTSWGWYSSK